MLIIFIYYSTKRKNGCFFDMLTPADRKHMALKYAAWAGGEENKKYINDLFFLLFELWPVFDKLEIQGLNRQGDH
jgi:hypothetical protein